MATLHDIASKLGIAKSTVSKALNNASDVSPDTKKKVLAAAVELGYANRRQQNKERKICILIANMNYETPNQFGHDIIVGFKGMAEPEGWIVDIVPLTLEFQRLTPYGVFMMEHNYQAAFLLGLSLLDPWMQEFKSVHIPTVLHDNYVKDNPYVASISYDSQEAFDLAVKYLKQLGHTKIGLISGPLESYILKARYLAYLSALEKYDLEINDHFIGLGYYVSESTKTHIPRLMEQGVTAILFSHDIRAISAIGECNERNIKIGKDLSIIGFDDLPLAAHVDPPLTTLRQDRFAIGKCGYYAVSCLLNNIPIGSISLRASLIIRGSVCPASPAV